MNLEHDQRTIRSPRRDAGYFLIECLIYMGILVLVMAMAFGAFYRCLENSRSLARSAEGIIQVLRAGELWRSDIRQAIGPPKLQSEPGLFSCEILRTNGAVAYILAEDSIWRKEGEGSPTELVKGVRQFSVVKDQRTYVTSWRWEIELMARKKGARVRPLFTFQAVPPASSL